MKALISWSLMKYKSDNKEKNVKQLVCKWVTKFSKKSIISLEKEIVYCSSSQTYFSLKKHCPYSTSAKKSNAARLAERSLLLVEKRYAKILFATSLIHEKCNFIL